MDESLKDLNDFLLSNYSEDIISSNIEHDHISICVVFSSIAFMVQYILGGTISIPVGTVLIAMISVHFLIGLGEGVITALIVGLIIRVRPDLIYAYDKEDKNTKAVSFYGLFIVLILLLSLITPFASSSPDGLESVAEEFGFQESCQG